MKLVVNKRYGGFCLSPKAVARLAELRGQKAYFFVGGIGGRPHVQVTPEETTGMFWSAYNTQSPVAGPSTGEWGAMSHEERQSNKAKFEDEHIDARPKDRADPLLVRVVEELGEEANGLFAKLKIVEIPDGVDYQIDDDDGFESIHEKHRSW
jgi:hypothetical protein